MITWAWFNLAGKTEITTPPRVLVPLRPGSWSKKTFTSNDVSQERKMRKARTFTFKLDNIGGSLSKIINKLKLLTSQYVCPEVFLLPNGKGFYSIISDGKILD